MTKAAGDTWFTLSATEGPAGYSEVELSLDENPGAARSAQLAFACGDAIVPFRLSQGALSAGYDSPDYYFYVTFGTMPTLYAGIHLLSHDKPSYVFYSRSRTFDPAEFPGRAEVTIAADRTADATQAEMEGMAREMKRRILEINSPDGRLRPLCGRPPLPDRLRLVRGAGDRLGTGQGEYAFRRYGNL